MHQEKMHVSPLNVITWLHPSAKTVKVPYQIPKLDLVDNGDDHYMIVNDIEAGTNPAGFTAGEKFKFSKCLSTRKHGIIATSAEAQQIVRLALTGFNAALIMLSVGDAESKKLRKDTLYQVIALMNVELDKLNIKRREEEHTIIEVDYTYIGVVDNCCYDLRAGKRIDNAELLEKGLEPFMKRVPHANRIWEQVKSGSNIPFIIQLRLTDDSKFLGNLMVVDLLQPEFQKPVIIAPACSIYYSFTQLRKTLVQAVNTHEFSKPFSLDLDSCVLTKLLTEYLTGLGRTVVVMHLNESLNHNMEETLHALRFAHFLQTIQCCAIHNKPDIRVEYYRACLVNAIRQYETEKSEHSRCKENLKLQEEELSRLTEQTKLQEQRVKELMAECSTLQQQLHKQEKEKEQDNKEKEKGKEIQVDAFDVPKADRDFDEISDLHTATNTINISPDTSAAKDHEATAPPRLSTTAPPPPPAQHEHHHHHHDPPPSPDILLERGWRKYLASKAAYESVLWEEERRQLQIELATAMVKPQSTLNSVLTLGKTDYESAASKPAEAEAKSNHMDREDVANINASLANDDNQQEVRNAPKIVQFDDKSRYYEPSIKPSQHSREGASYDSLEGQYDAQQQLCDEINLVLTETIQKHERAERQYQSVIWKLSKQLDRASNEAAEQYREWSLEKQEMQKKLQAYDQRSRILSDEMGALKAQISLFDREKSNYKDKIATTEAQRKEEKERDKQQIERLRSERDQLYNYVEQIQQNIELIGDSHGLQQQQIYMPNSTEIKEDTNPIPSLSAFAPEQQQQEQCMYALEKDDQGRFKYDVDDDEDIVMQSSSVISARFDTEDLQQQHSPPARITDTPRMLKRTKVAVQSIDNHDTASATTSSSGSKIARTIRSSNDQISNQNAGTVARRDPRRRLSNNSSIGTTGNQDYPPTSSSFSRQQGSIRRAESGAGRDEGRMRMPLQTINENIQGSNKKRRVNTKR